MRDRDNILEVLDLKPDFMGFIFYRDTPRFVGDDFILPRKMPSSTKRVGVFVNDSTESIMNKVNRYELDFVQLHGAETPEQCRELREEGVGVIKVFSVDDHTDFDLTAPYRHVVDYFLFDTKGKRYGGNATRFSWDVLSKYDQSVPFFLSGGITPENVSEISMLRNYNLFAIDINSGVEVRPALKDADKIRAIKKVITTKTITS